MIGKIMLAILIYLPFQLALNPAEGVDLASIRIIIPLFFAIWLSIGLAKKKVSIPFGMETWFLVAFIFFSGLSIFYADNQNWGIRKFLFLLTFFPVYFASADLASKNQGLWKKIIDLMIIGAALAALVGLLQFLLQFIIGLDPALRFWESIIVPFLGKSFAQSVIEHPSWMVNLGGRTVMRSIAFFPDPHMFAYYLNLALPWPILFFIYQRTKRYFYFFSACLIFLALILTFSRGAYLGTTTWMISGILYYLIRNFEGKKLILTIMIMLSLLAILVFSDNPINQRFLSIFSSDDNSNRGRISIWKETLEIIHANPVGVGIGNYPLAVKPSAGYREPIYAHNLYLDLAVETGFQGLLSFLGLILFSALSFWKKSRRNKIYLAGFLSLIGFFIHSLFETPLYSVQVLPLLLIIFSLSAAYEKK